MSIVYLYTYISDIPTYIQICKSVQKIYGFKIRYFQWNNEIHSKKMMVKGACIISIHFPGTHFIHNLHMFLCKIHKRWRVSIHRCAFAYRFIRICQYSMSIFQYGYVCRHLHPYPPQKKRKRYFQSIHSNVPPFFFGTRGASQRTPPKVPPPEIRPLVSLNKALLTLRIIFEDFKWNSCVRFLEAFRRWGIVDHELTAMTLERLQETLGKMRPQTGCF